MNRAQRGFLANTILMLGLFALGRSAYGQVTLASAGRIKTIAGTGVAGYTGNGGLALSAKLSSPNGVAIDPNNGTIYVSDSGNSVVRAINPITGDISLYAGGTVIVNTPRTVTWPNGTVIYCAPLLVGDGGPATSAMLDGPAGLAVDKYSNLYIAEPDGNRIRMVTPSGIISTLAGNGCPYYQGDGQAADIDSELYAPFSVAIDYSTGDLYIAEYQNNRIRKMQAINGVVSGSSIITTIMGIGASGTVEYGYNTCIGNPSACPLFAPTGVAVDSNRNLYIADSGNEIIWRLNLTSSPPSSSVFAGTPPTTGYTCISTPGTNYPCNGTSVIGYTGDKGPALQATLDGPSGVAVDSTNNVYIADENNNVIRKVLASTGYIYSVIGSGTAGYAGDGGPANAAEFGKPGYVGVSNIALDPKNDLYLADESNNRLRAVTAVSIVAAPCSPNPTGYGAGTTCTATVTGNNPTGTIKWTVNGSTWQSGPLSQGMNTASGLTTESTGTYTIEATYYGDANNLAGVAATFLSIETAQAITFAPPASPVTYGVAPVTLSATASSGLTPTFSIVSGPGAVSGTTLTVTGPGTIVVAANQAGNATYAPAPQVTQPVVVNYALPAHGVITTYAGNGTAGYAGDGGLAANAELNTPFAVAVDASGNLYIADASNNVIRKLTASTGNISTVAAAGFGGDGVAVDSTGNFYVANSAGNRALLGLLSNGDIYLISGSVNGTAGYSGDGGAATSALLDDPVGIAVSLATGNVYIADTANNRIRMINASTDVISTVAGDGVTGFAGDGSAATSAEIDSPYGAAVDSSGNIYIADTFNNRIRKVTASTGNISTVAGNGFSGYSGDGGAATSAELCLPTGVAVDSSGNIYIADIGNNRVRKITLSNGVISTVAGNGTAGFSGDNGSATNAKLYQPSGVALDASGNLYIADAYNNRIRVVGH